MRATAAVRVMAPERVWQRSVRRGGTCAVSACLRRNPCNFSGGASLIFVHLRVVAHNTYEFASYVYLTGEPEICF